MNRLLVSLGVAAGFSGSVALAKPVNELQDLAQGVPQAVLSSTYVDHVSSDATIHFTVSLNPSDPDGLQRFVDDVSNPKSPNYRHFITPEQVGLQFGPSVTVVNSVVSYLQSKGVQIDLVSNNRLGILAHATGAQVEAAFHTTLNDYQLNDGSARQGETYRSYSAPLQVPASLGASILNVFGLENYTKPQRRYLTPSMTRVLYGTNGFFSLGNEGTNRTVAISNFDGFALSNVPTFYSTFGLPTPSGGVEANIKITAIDGGSQFTAPAGEGDLDIQMSLAVAPLCSLHIYDGGNEDLLGVLTQEASDNTSDVITESYGWELDPTSEASAHNEHLSMNAEGITYMAASGDSGTAIAPYTYPDCDPEVLIVGGTSATTSDTGLREQEVGWNDAYGAGAGGWTTDTSSFNVLPSWQKGTGVPTNIPFRLVPDVALNASPNTGYIFFGPYNGTEGVELSGGGTSAASPTFAASLALTEEYLISQKALQENSAGHYRLGRVDDLFYQIGDAADVFYDITSGTNGVLPNGQTSEAGVGWDFDSGWGSMNFNNLATYLISVPAVSKVVLSPTTLEGGSSTSVTGTITLAAASGNGVVVSLSSSNAAVVAPSSVTVAAGKTTASFTATTHAVSTTTSVSITALTNAGKASATVSLTQPKATKVSLSTTSVASGGSVTGTVTLDQAAPTGGVSVALSSSNSSAATTATSVTVTAGSTTATFPIASKSVASNTAVTISATSGGATASTSLTVGAPVLSKVTVSAAVVIGSVTPENVTFTISAAAPAGGIAVAIGSSNAAVAKFSVASVTIPAGAASATVAMTTYTVNSTTTLSVIGRAGPAVSTTIAVRPPYVSGLTVSPTAVTGAGTATGTVTVDGPAGASGLVVSLKSSSTYATLPATVTIPVGKSSATFTITTTAPKAAVAATITATYGVAKTATLTVNP